MGRSDTLKRGRWETVEPMGCGELQVTKMFIFSTYEAMRRRSKNTCVIKLVSSRLITKEAYESNE